MAQIYVLMEMLDIPAPAIPVIQVSTVPCGVVTPGLESALVAGKRSLRDAVEITASSEILQSAWFTLNSLGRALKLKSLPEVSRKA